MVQNDAFMIPAIYNNPILYPNYELIIVNRWGDVVYSTKEYDPNGWDGTFQNRPLPSATYYYILRLNLAEGKIVYGEITLIR